MDAKTQIIVLIFSYVYGLIFYDLFLLNNYISKDKKRIFKCVTAMLFIYNIVLLYIILVFKMNNGNFHVYFMLMIMLGFGSNIRLTKYLLNNVKFLSLLEKVKKKCYTKKK